MALFKKATKTQSKLRMALYGVSGSGKTYSALSLATGLGGRIALIDTERGSASKYAGRFNFDVLEMTPPFTPASYVQAIKAAEAEGYDVLVIDSLSHAWSGAGGALEMVDNAAARSSSKNTYTAWRDVTPQHNALVDAILQVRCHVIATMRSKTEYVMEPDSRGKMMPRKVSMAPIQRDGMEYEFDVFGEMDINNNLIVQKSRCEALAGGVFNKPNGQVSDLLKAWLSDGAPVVEPDPVAESVGKLGGVIRTEATLSNLLTRFDALPDGTARTAALRTLKADINTEAAKRGIDPFEGRSGEALPDAEKRMRGVLDACIAKDAQPELVAA